MSSPDLDRRREIAEHVALSWGRQEPNASDFEEADKILDMQVPPDVNRRVLARLADATKIEALTTENKRLREAFAYAMEVLRPLADRIRYDTCDQCGVCIQGTQLRVGEHDEGCWAEAATVAIEHYAATTESTEASDGE